MAEVMISTWPPVLPSFGLFGIMLSRSPNCSKPVPSSDLAVTVNGMPEMENCTPGRPGRLRIARAAAVRAAGTAIIAARRSRT